MKTTFDDSIAAAAKRFKEALTSNDVTEPADTSDVEHLLYHFFDKLEEFEREAIRAMASGIMLDPPDMAGKVIMPNLSRIQSKPDHDPLAYMLRVSGMLSAMSTNVLLFTAQCMATRDIRETTTANHIAQFANMTSENMGSFMQQVFGGPAAAPKSLLLDATGSPVH